jgi:hypothetical protein
MNNIATAAWLIAATCVLVGCAGHTHRLVADDEPGQAVGTIRHEGLAKPTMVMEFAGKQFDGEGFEIRRTQDLAELRRRYGPGRHYDQIRSGVDSDHYIYSAEPELRAADGAAMKCALIWRARGAPAGTCRTEDGKEVDFHSE